MIANRNRNGPGPRRGFTLPELAISAFVLVVAMGLSVRMLGWIGAERRASERRQWAIQTASNVMERLTVEPFERVTLAVGNALAEKTGAPSVLPAAAWEISVDDERDTPVPARRVSLRLRWRERSGEWVAPVRLVAWVHDHEPERRASP